MTASARLELRIRPDSRARLERAAALVQVPVSDFVRSAAEERAEQVLNDHDATTRVPATFFDELLDALDGPARVNRRLAAAGRRAQRSVTRD